MERRFGDSFPPTLLRDISMKLCRWNVRRHIVAETSVAETSVAGTSVAETSCSRFRVSGVILGLIFGTEKIKLEINKLGPLQSLGLERSLFVKVLLQVSREVSKIRNIFDNFGVNLRTVFNKKQQIALQK